LVEEIEDGFLILLLNVELNQACLDEGDHVSEHGASALLHLDKAFKWAELGVLKLNCLVFVFLQVRNEVAVLVLKDLADDDLGLFKFADRIDVFPVVFYLEVFYQFLKVEASVCAREVLGVVWAGAKQVLVEKDQLSWVQEGVLEVVERLFEVEHANESDPAAIQEELIRLPGEVSISLVDLQHEYLFGFLNPAERQQEIDLVLCWDFFELVNLSIDAVLGVRVVVRNKYDVTILHVQAR